MISLLKTLFITNWQRKAISLFLAIIIWLVVDASLTATKTLNNVSVRVINIPAGKTIENLQNNGLMPKKISLTLTGNKTLLEEIDSNDLEVVIDAAGHLDQWVASISKKNLVSLNPDVDLSTGIGKITHQNFLIRMTKLVTDKIPIVITQPIGEPPRDYQFLDVWPYHLNLTLSGPEDVIKRLKAKGPKKLTFNLNDITKSQLDTLELNENGAKGEEVSFFIPDAWKQLNLPALSDTPFEIDDPHAKALRIDFVRCALVPLQKPIPVALFFPPECRQTLNPESCAIAEKQLVRKLNGLSMITEPLYVKGVSRLFIQIVRDMLQIAVIVVPKEERPYLEWSVQFINPSILEDRYVAARLADSLGEEAQDLSPNLREEYLRNQFRSYMNHFQLYKSNDQRFDLKIELSEKEVIINEAAHA